MPRIPVRTEPYSSPSRQHRHFKNKRDQVLRALGKAAYINGSHFAIMWVSARGDVETYASEAFQGRLEEWFGKGGIGEEAKALVQSGSYGSGEGDKREIWDQDDDEEEDVDAEEEEEDVFLDGSKEKLSDPADEGKGKGKRPAPLNTTIANQHFLRSHSSLDSAPRSAPLFSTAPFTPLSAPLTSTPHLASSTRLLPRPSLTPTPTHTLLLPTLATRTAFLELRFGQLQQGVCKTVAKAWIKIIEPKKQTRCPYNKGEDGKPSWWPAGVRHKEPDHLMKAERHALLLTILRSPKVKVARLQLATAEVVALIKADKVSLLMDVYRVAREEEKLRERSEVDGEVRVGVSTLEGWCEKGGGVTGEGRRVARSLTPEVEGARARKRTAATMVKSSSMGGVAMSRKRRSIATSSLSAEVRTRALPHSSFGPNHDPAHQPLIGLGLVTNHGASFGGGAGMPRSHSFSAIPSNSHFNDPSSSNDTQPWPPASFPFSEVNGLVTPLTGSAIDPSFPAHPDPSSFYYPPPPPPPHHTFAYPPPSAQDDFSIPPYNALGLENWSFANLMPDLSWQSQPSQQTHPGESFSFETLNSGPRTPSPSPPEHEELRLNLPKSRTEVRPNLAAGAHEAFWMGTDEVAHFGAQSQQQ